VDLRPPTTESSLCRADVLDDPRGDSLCGIVIPADDGAAAKAGSPAAGPQPRSPRLGTVARNLTLVNLTYTLAALVTSPLQARALGPAGRGELAAVTVVLSVFAALGDFGLGAYAVRESARGRAVRMLVGSIGPQLLVLGIVYAALAPLVAHFVADGRDAVAVLLLIGLLLTPLTLPSGLTTAIVWGRQRWGLYALQRLALPVGTLTVYSVLYLLDSLTVMSAGITLIGLSIAGVLPGYIVLRGAGRPEHDRGVAQEARRYGRRVWVTVLASQTNARLDQLLMTRLVPSSELGLYVVAFNFSLLQSSFTNAVSSALLPRIAADDASVVARALRIVVLLTALLSTLLFVSAPFVVPAVFGDNFSEAVLMCQILVIAAVPFGIVQLMTATLNGINKPGIAARGELISIAITVPLLILFVGQYGGEAAAVVSLTAYTVTALYLVFSVRRLLGLGWRELFVPRRADLSALTSLPGVGRLRRR
jgi:O-antigen/teichoic acid export membrane protein